MAKYIISDIFKGDYPISQYYGNNPAYYKQFGFNGHEGVDWATPIGVEILAPFNRNIILQDQDIKSGAYGNYIVVWDPEQKCAIWYCHLDVNNVTIGQEYKKGTVLGKTGNSGNSTGPHLHVNFVETDANGVRLNQNNGFKGMLNILDGNLVEWKLGDQPQPVPAQPEGTITISSKTFEELVGKSTKYDDFVANGFTTSQVIKDQLKNQEETINNLNAQISILQSEHSAKDAKISSLESQVLTLSQSASGLEEQTKQLIQVTKERDELELQKTLWVKQEKGYLAKISELTKENTTLKKNSFSALLKNILDGIFRK